MRKKEKNSLGYFFMKHQHEIHGSARLIGEMDLETCQTWHHSTDFVKSKTVKVCRTLWRIGVKFRRILMDWKTMLETKG